MYAHILVPLDGSTLSEAAVEHAVQMAEHFGAELTLLRVVSLPSVPGGDVAAVEQTLVAESEAYLRDISSRLTARRVTIHTTVRVGKPADTIIEHAGQDGNTVVVMATHGHRRIEQWPLGSIAEKVLRSMLVPVFLVRAPLPEHATE